MSADSHNAAILPLLKLIIHHGADEADQWVLIETLCLGIGRLHQRTPRQTAEFVETIAHRLASGEREARER
ncbi:MAG: hypothetical protein U5M50_10570 [Sphingobium sp.]|nr:hypothetical protein [Sphingobium sp.]